MPSEDVPEYANKRVLILGVGNVLFGDDGFGPAATDYLLKKYKIPHDVHVMDVGISAGDILFNVALSPVKPKRVIILDAVDIGRKPGEVFELSIDDLPASKMADFSTHFFPSPNMLKELQQDMGVDVVVLACQAKRMPDSVSPGLSDSVTQALPKAAEMALQLARKEKAKRKN